MPRVRSALLSLIVCATTSGVLTPAPAHAHGGPPPDISSWGPFDAATAQCQRVISGAIQRCFDRAIAVKRHCMDTQLAGGQCDEADRDNRIAAAQQAAEGAVAGACGDLQLQTLHFLNLDDAKSDVARGCNDQSDAALSVLYGPAMARGTAATGNTSVDGCMQRTAALGVKLLRFSTRLKSRALDRIASRDLPPSQRLALLAEVDRRVAALRQKVIDRIAAACPSFGAIYDRDSATVMSVLEPRGDCVVFAGYVQSAIACPTPVCGNGVKETGEQCDDGNQTNDDLCHNDCTKNDCAVFPTTYDLIQAAIFEQHGCTNDLCHGSIKQGGLDLRAGFSYEALTAPSTIAPDLKRIEPGDETRSLLWLKLAAATLGRTGVPGSPMPLGLPALSANELEALRVWIHAAAPSTGVVAGVAELLNACALPADPIQIQPPDSPPAGTGVQIEMPGWDLRAHSEGEVCFVSYYDVSSQVPAEFQGPDGTFRFRRQIIVQDPQSHHLIVNLYRGASTIDDPLWGAFTCKGGPLDGQTCDPKQSDSCGTGGLCGSAPTSSVACIGFGPSDAQTGFAGFTGTQQTSYEQTFAPGVYEEVPLKGIIIWNSHAFNLTRSDAKQRAWMNFYFAPPEDQKYPVQGIFDLSDIFGMVVPPFKTEEICNTHLLDQGTYLFHLSSHMHKRGKRFTIFAPDGSLMYTSNIYNDPVQLYFDPPLVFNDPDPATRTLRYCALYDNGATDPTEVKRKSTSPDTPIGFPSGGPCTTPTGCTSGKVGQSCSGNTQAKRNASCDTSVGQGDGVCDACVLRGGVTTEDEMFILLGTYYVP